MSQTTGPSDTTPETQTSTTTETSSTDKPGETVLTKKEGEAAKPVVPEKYADFTLPEGIKLDGEQLTAATALFKESGLSQEAAQKMVDFHVAQMKAAAEAPAAAYATMREKWQTDSKSDPAIGPHTAKIKETFGRALDTLGDAKLVADFRQALDLTGMGDHPAVIKVLAKLSEAVVEGRHVTGRNPSTHGQLAPGATDRPSAAHALYPNLR